MTPVSVEMLKIMMTNAEANTGTTAGVLINVRSRAQQANGNATPHR
jgi:hypothetical protein